MKHADIIDALGGIALVATELGRHRSRIGAWRTDGIPAVSWPAIVAMARRRGRTDITLDVLQAGQGDDGPVTALRRGRKPGHNAQAAA